MIKIYSDESKLNNKYEYSGDIRGIKAIFMHSVFTEEFDSTEYYIIETIDKAKVIAPNIFETPYGTILKSQLSSGSMTCLLANFWKKNGIKNMALETISCGGNALSILYEIVNNTDIALVQGPMILGSAHTDHVIMYNDGEFKGKFNEYRVHLMEIEEPDWTETDEVDTFDLRRWQK